MSGLSAIEKAVIFDVLIKTDANGLAKGIGKAKRKLTTLKRKDDGDKWDRLLEVVEDAKEFVEGLPPYETTWELPESVHIK